MSSSVADVVYQIDGMEGSADVVLSVNRYPTTITASSVVITTPRNARRTILAHLDDRN